MTKKIFLFLTLIAFFSSAYSQINKQQKGLLWQITGNGLKKPSYVYGTMHVSQKIAFHLGDSFYIALSKCDVVALEQNLDSVIQKWISDDETLNPEDANKVYQRFYSYYNTLNLFDFSLNSYDKNLISRKLSSETGEVNYLLKRGEQDDFEEDAWLDLYIYQLAKKLGKEFTGVEGYEESRELVKKSQKEPKDAKKKKPKRFNYGLRQQISEAYRKGDIYMIDSIDRMSESEHYLEYMLYKRNANMVRRMDSIMKLNKTLFTGVGCAHLPGTKGVLNMLVNMGYKVRPVQSIALEKSKMAKKIEEKEFKNTNSIQTSEDGLFSALLPNKLTKVRIGDVTSTYLCPDLANSHYFQIEKITSNATFSGKSPEQILEEIDTLIFENIPGEILNKKSIVSNGFTGIEVITKLKNGNLNRFYILTSPFNIYIIRLSGKKMYAISKEGDMIFKSLKINEGSVMGYQRVHSPDSIFSLELPVLSKSKKFAEIDKSLPFYEHLVFDKKSGNTYLIKQIDYLNNYYLEADTFELNLMSRSFANSDDFKIQSKKHFVLNGYNALDVQYTNNLNNPILARFMIIGTRYIMFVLKPELQTDFTHSFFSSLQINQKPKFTFFNHQDTSLHFSVETPVLPLLTKEFPSYSYFIGNDDELKEDKKTFKKYIGQDNEVYFTTGNTSEFIIVRSYQYGYYENQSKKMEDYYKNWIERGSLKLLNKKEFKKKGINYIICSYSDTNTNRQIKILSALNGMMKYNVEAFVDTVSGQSELVDRFLNTFEVKDTSFEGDIFQKKGYRFIQDFTSKDSITRKASIKYLKEVEFDKKDIPHLSRIIDTLSMKGDAASIRTMLINKLSFIDSASDLTIPILQKLYNRFSDTAFLQIEILKAIAKQRNQAAYNAIKPILADDIPISDSDYEMNDMLYEFSDSLELTKYILPELLDLTNIYEYRNTAYSMISRMKDSGVISEKDYASIQEKLIYETNIEYKRMMASLTKVVEDYSAEAYEYAFDIQKNNINSIKFGEMQYNYNSYSDYGYERSILADILDLSLPFHSKSKKLQTIVSKILNINNNDKRLDLMPVLMKYGFKFHDTVYHALAKNKDTRAKLYEILVNAKQLNHFPKEYLNHKDYVLAELYATNSEYNKIDTVDFYAVKTLQIGKKSALVYVYKFKYEENDEWQLFMSSAMPLDTNKLNLKTDVLIFESSIESLEKTTEEKVIDEMFFLTEMAHRRNTNGSYFNVYANKKSKKYGFDSYY